MRGLGGVQSPDPVLRPPRPSVSADPALLPHEQPLLLVFSYRRFPFFTSFFKFQVLPTAASSNCYASQCRGEVEASTYLFPLFKIPSLSGRTFSFQLNEGFCFTSCLHCIPWTFILILPSLFRAFLSCNLRPPPPPRHSATLSIQVLREASQACKVNRDPLFSSFLVPFTLHSQYLSLLLYI